MGYYDETRRKYISKYGRLAELRTSEDDYRAESEREKEIKRIDPGTCDPELIFSFKS